VPPLIRYIWCLSVLATCASQHRRKCPATVAILRIAAACITISLVLCDKVNVPSDNFDNSSREHGSSLV
jgi:hypothetical protein